MERCCFNPNRTLFFNVRKHLFILRCISAAFPLNLLIDLTFFELIDDVFVLIDIKLFKLVDDVFVLIDLKLFELVNNDFVSDPLDAIKRG